MKPTKHKTVLFLCTGNYYRSRFAEVFFNSVAEKMRLPWRADSRGLALERGSANVGPMAASALAAAKTHGIRSDALTRMPLQAELADLEAAACVVALKDAEHRPLLLERYAAFAGPVEYWHVDDELDVLPKIEQQVMDLVARLLGGGGTAPPPPPPPPEKAKPKPLVRVGRETKGRRGKGVTLVSDVPLDDAGIQDLAAKLKNRCGTGGTVKDGQIEIQGDQRERVCAVLEELGYKVKRVGG